LDKLRFETMATRKKKYIRTSINPNRKNGAVRFVRLTDSNAHSKAIKRWYNNPTESNRKKLVAAFDKMKANAKPNRKGPSEQYL
jgi:hypothetical protein